MADGKKSFVLYSDLIHTVEHLKDIQAGKLFKHILKYVNDQNPETNDPIVKLAFEPIKQQLKRDLRDWEEKKVKRSEAGKAGADKRWQKMANDGNAISGMAKMAVTVNGNVNDTVNVNDNVILFSIERCAEISLNDSRWVKANQTSERELKKFNEYLVMQGKYEMNPIDYKKYFCNIKGKHPHLVKGEMSIEQWRELAKQQDLKESA